MTIEPILTDLRGWVWGPALGLLLLGTGLSLWILLRGLPARGLAHALSWALGGRREEGGEGDVTHGQALAIALSATAGAGGIVGVTVALSAGGPGALLWIWTGCLLAMATRYAEAVLSVRYRETDSRGAKAGGPMYFLEHGLGGRGLGRLLGVSFAALTLPAAVGIGAGLPATSAAAALGLGSGWLAWVVGAAVALAVGVVALGGVRRVGRVLGLALPALLLAYVGLAVTVVIRHADRLSGALDLVLGGALGVEAAAGGALGLGAFEVVRHGLMQGLLAGHAGLGSGGIAAAAARTRAPARQALVAMTAPLLEMLVLGSATGLALLCAGPLEGAASPPGVVRALLGLAPGGAGLVALLALLSVAAMVAWAYYGERAAVYLLGERAVGPFRLVFLGAVLVAFPLPLDGAWRALELLGGLAALPTLAGIGLLSGLVWRETRSYMGKNGRDGRPELEPVSPGSGGSARGRTRESTAARVAPRPDPEA